MMDTSSVKLPPIDETVERLTRDCVKPRDNLGLRPVLVDSLKGLGYDAPVIKHALDRFFSIN